MSFLIVLLAAMLDPAKVIAALCVIYFGLKAARAWWSRLLVLALAFIGWVLISSWLYAEFGIRDWQLQALASAIWFAVFTYPLWKRQLRRDAVRLEHERLFPRT